MKKILIIDDDEVVLELLQHILEKNGFTIATLQRNEGGLKIIELFKPDIILLDYYFDQGNSAGLAREIKSLPATKNIKIIFISINEALKNFKKYYGDDFMEKPLKMPQLLFKINSLLVK